MRGGETSGGASKAIVGGTGDLLGSASTVEQTTPPQDGRTVVDPRMDLVRHRLQHALFDRTSAAPQVGRFELLRQVGEGAMGTIFAAYDPRLQREVALKLLKNQDAGDASAAQGRLLREARALARLAHPNIVTVYEVDSYEGNVVLAMELVRGPNLRQWLSREPHHWREVAALLLAAGEGIVAAHELGLIHRDIKPDNILIGPDGRPRVGDFGLVRGEAETSVATQPTISGADHGTVMTRSGTLVGTPRYMAPEQLRGQRADAASDQFSFCATAFEALFGMRAFGAEQYDALLAAIVAGDIAAIDPRHPAAKLLPPLRRGMAADPAARHPTMRALLNALQRPLEQPKRARRGGWIALAAAGLTALVAWFGHATWRWFEPAASSPTRASPQPEDEAAYTAAMHAAQESRPRKCVQATQSGPPTERLLRLRVACAEGTANEAELTQACRVWHAHYSDKEPPGRCDPLVEKAIALRKAGRAREGFELLERSPPATYRRVEISLCASAIHERSYYVRLCRYTQKHYATGPCPDEIIDISP